MTLKSKIDNAIWTSSSNEVVDNLEQIADEFAIGFAEWLPNLSYVIQEAYTKKELLEIYKKTL